MNVQDISLVCGIMFVASTVRSALGFGEALIAMPLLAFVVPLNIAAPFVAMVSMLNACLILAREWRMISFRETGSLTVAALVGVYFGQKLLGLQGYDSIVKGSLAVVILIFSGWSLWSPQAFRLKTDRMAPVFGFISGVLGGAYNTAGPPLVMFGTLRRWPTERFRANLQSYFLAGGTTVLAFHCYNGRVTADVLTLFAIVVPVIFLTSFLGRLLTQHISPTQFLKIVHVALLLVGSLLLAASMKSLLT